LFKLWPVLGAIIDNRPLSNTKKTHKYCGNFKNVPGLGFLPHTNLFPD